MVANKITTHDEQIRVEVARIKEAHPYRGDYREQLAALITTLFFTFGERAGANRLVALLAENGKSPSSGTAQDEINKFWERLRNTAKFSLPRPDLPPEVVEVLSQLGTTFWEKSLEHASLQFDMQRAEFESASAAAAEDLQRAAAKLETANATLEDQLVEIRKKTEEVQQARLALNEENTLRKAAERRIEELNRQIEAMHVDRRNETEKLNGIVSELTSSIQRIEREQSRLLVSNDDYKQQAARDRQEKERTIARLEKADSELHQERQQHREAVAMQGALNGQLATMEIQLKGLQAERDSLYSSIEAAAAAQGELRVQLEQKDQLLRAAHRDLQEKKTPKRKKPGQE